MIPSTLAEAYANGPPTVGLCLFCRRERLLWSSDGGRCSSNRCAQLAGRLERARERQRLGQKPHGVEPRWVR